MGDILGVCMYTCKENRAGKKRRKKDNKKSASVRKDSGVTETNLS